MSGSSSSMGISRCSSLGVGIGVLRGAMDSRNPDGFISRRGVDRLALRRCVGLTVLPPKGGAGVLALALVVFWLNGARRRGAKSEQRRVLEPQILLPGLYCEGALLRYPTNRQV